MSRQNKNKTKNMQTNEQSKEIYNIELGNTCSKKAFDWAKKTFVNRQGKTGAIPMDLEGGFSNMLLFGNQRIGIGSDGIGTKAEIAERTGIYKTLGYDLVAMVADDLAPAGFEATSLSNILDVDYLSTSIVEELMEGLHDACNFCDMSVTGGEIAELGDRISGYGENMHFNWCATAIGVLPEKLTQPINGSTAKVGDVVIALKSQGFRSNGFSLVRKIMKEVFGNDWHLEPFDDKQTWGEALLTPSLIYAPFINDLIAADLIPTGMAHITGGGIVENLNRVLKINQLGANLTNLFEPLEMMQQLIKMGNIPLEQAYLYWNMGNGMLLVSHPDTVEGILEKADKWNYMAQVAGEVNDSKLIKI